MTSFVLASVANRPTSYPPLDDTCTFCRIIEGKDEAHIVYEDDDVIAFLGETGRTSTVALVADHTVSPQRYLSHPARSHAPRSKAALCQVVRAAG